MPKIIELTVEIQVDKVTCPGVWLCQDGRVSLTLFALNTSYQTCMLPPLFPLLYKDVFYFKKRFEQTCALNNICCLLEDETIYCELVQWTNQCHSEHGEVLAQYLGNLNDVLFPPNMCSRDGVDLLMRRSKHFPGILSPKIEVATKVRIDEVRDNSASPSFVKPCHCTESDDNSRQKQVCHSPLYHRVKCTKKCGDTNSSRSRSKSRSCSSLKAKKKNSAKDCCDTRQRQCSEIYVPITSSTRQGRSKSPRSSFQYSMYNVKTPCVGAAWKDVTSKHLHETCREVESDILQVPCYDDDCEKELTKTLLESLYIDQQDSNEDLKCSQGIKRYKIKPCICEICKKYYELFHCNSNSVSKNKF